MAEKTVQARDDTSGMMGVRKFKLIHKHQYEFQERKGTSDTTEYAANTIRASLDKNNEIKIIKDEHKEKIMNSEKYGI
ncbi:hypothetical protein J437_LFUL014930 [Ladona fulva]|uniref:Uncharacterized protein n=1 Tax=Ladona fulva TaxID=123851 RepID=A0A8K0KHU0_LADFU|nr:hypothetical protein J437_LFUL014930 [Ladona fulva]